jgi:hypothetical protein
VPNEPTVVSVVLVSEAEVAPTVTIYHTVKRCTDLFVQSKHVSNRPCVIPALYTPTVQTKERSETVDSGRTKTRTTTSVPHY